ncbi:DUF7079 family protein [Pseudomonas asplenii]|uniref:DUF7079 family protein n=1 Tax=Pseudomonas asplenii TaxID=53407 RepID=UPI00037D8849|nr:hypothetical protein [Pseudomonas fuscovaginae]
MGSVESSRLKIWQALSSLFLDTEIDELTYDYIARTVLESGYPTEEVHRILWNEVFPVLEANLRCVAGEWAGWSDDWLAQHLEANDKPVTGKRRGAIAREIATCWEHVASRVSGRT